MTVDPPFHIYREQLSSLYHGVGLWKPSPGDLYDMVSIGDVGYVSESDDGAFIRMFNVRLPWDHESNSRLGEPDRYDPLSFRNLTIRRETFGQVDHHSRSVIREETVNNTLAAIPEQAEGYTYRCHGRGALLSLPHGGYCENAINTRVFEKYIQDNVVSWFDWAKSNLLGVERLEDIILVSGCTLVTSWAAAVFDDTTMDAEISLASRSLDNGGASFVWRNARGAVMYHNSRHDPQNLPATRDQCVFIKGFRAKRILFWTKPIRAAADPLPDDPENRREDEVEVTQAPWVPNYDDPLIGILDYIAEECHEDAIAEDTMAVVHDDNLRLVEKVETLTAYAVLKYLRENKIPVFVENGAMASLCPHSHVNEHEKTERSHEANITDKPDDDAFGVLPHTSPPHYRAISSVVDTSPPSSPSFFEAAGQNLPLLPNIQSGRIQNRIFTHSSLAGENRYESYDFQRPASNPSVDNQELGQIGDQVFASAVTNPIQDGVSLNVLLDHRRADTSVHTPSEFSALSTHPVQYQEERSSTEMSQEPQDLGRGPIAGSSRSPLQPEGREVSRRRGQYRCGICAEEYKRKQEATRHYRCVHEPPRSCPSPLCSFKWLRPSHLRRHINMCHPHIPPAAVDEATRSRPAAPIIETVIQRRASLPASLPAIEIDGILEGTRVSSPAMSCVAYDAQPEPTELMNTVAMVHRQERSPLPVNPGDSFLNFWSQSARLG